MRTVIVVVLLGLGWTGHAWAGGASCDDGTGRPDYKACAADERCNQKSLQCTTREAYSCDKNTDCNFGDCVDGYCENATACDSADGCRDGFFCDDFGFCLRDKEALCTVDTDCDGGQVCDDSGACVEVSQPAGGGGCSAVGGSGPAPAPLGLLLLLAGLFLSRFAPLRVWSRRLAIRR